MKYLYLFCLCIIITWSCQKNENIETSLNGLIEIAAKEIVIPLDSLFIIEKIPVNAANIKRIPVKITVNKTPLHSKLLAGKPTVFEADQKIMNEGRPVNIDFSKKIVVKSIINPLVKIPEIVVAKEATTKNDNYANFSFYKILQGLNHNGVRCMLQDNSSNIWVGTNGGGASCYNGKTFTNYTERDGLNSNFILSILKDKENNIWFGTNNGVCKYDGSSFADFSKNKQLNHTINCILEDKQGNIWFGTDNYGVYCYNRKYIINYNEKDGLINNTVTSMLEDKKGNIWLGTDNGPCLFNGKTFKKLSSNKWFDQNVVYDILEDRSGKIWLGTSMGVCSYNGNIFSVLTTKEGLIDKDVLSIAEDKKGHFWFGTVNGISCYDGSTFSNYTEKDGLSNNCVASILNDKNGDFWIGTIGGGLCRYDGGLFNHISEKQGLTNNIILSMAQNKNGELWFASRNGINSYNGTTLSQLNESPSEINSITVDTSDNLWVGSNTNGLFCYNNSSIQHFTTHNGLIHNNVTQIASNKLGEVWIGTQVGFSCYSGETFTNYRWRNAKEKNSISMVYEENGTIWIGTQNNGLYSCKGKSLIHFSKENGLLNNTIFSILKDKEGGLWIGTNDGLSYYNGKSFINFTEKEGLSNNAILSIIKDKKGDIWFGTRKGLSKISSKKLHYFKNSLKNQIPYDPIAEALFFNYGYNDGFLGSNCRKNSVLEDKNGTIWWGADVLTSYHPNGDVIDSIEPVVELTSVKLSDEEINWNKIYYTSKNNSYKPGAKDSLEVSNIKLSRIQFDSVNKKLNIPINLSVPYYTNNITFNFIGIHQQSRDHVKYQYILEGLESEWSPVTHKAEVKYGNLPSNMYVFKVKAMNKNGVWSNPIQYRFVIRPPWWQTWWARTFGVLFILAAFVLYTRWREKKLLLEKKVLERVVERRTKEVQEEKKIVERQKNLLEQKHKEITDSIYYAKRIQNGLYANQDFIKQYVKDTFVLFKPKDIVSGDFYWATEQNSKFYLAVCDSTGHGVPGSFMSLLNIGFLSEAIKEKHIAEPNNVFNCIRERLIETISKEGQKDGMDGVLLCIETNPNNQQQIQKITYAASNIEPLLIQKGKIIELTKDKMPIGKGESNESFSLNTLYLEPGDLLYIYTDGYADQFGGPKGKKFMSKNLRELLLKNSHLELDIQKELADEAIKTWIGDLEQTDDITLIGIKI